MIIPDVNLLIYAYDTNSPFHLKAAEWWQLCLMGKEVVGLPSPVLFGFLRVATSSRIFRHPMTPGEAIRHIQSWLQQPVVQILEAGPRHVHQVLKLIESAGCGGNLVTDAQIAAIAIENDATVYSSDTDFARFPQLAWKNPLSG
jgi:toxin-antitoxin system PIN domain toxin